MGWLLAVLLLLLYYASPLLAISLTGIKTFVWTLRKRELVAVFAMSSVFLAIIIALMVREKCVYFGDYGSYWYKTLWYQDTLSSNLADAVKNLAFSIDNTEYNDLACAIIALPLKIFGNSYFAFVILNVIMFYIPNAGLMVLTFHKVLEKHSLDRGKITWIYGYTLVFSVALLPILAGYVDIIGMLPLTTAYLLVIDRDFERIDVAKDVCLGISLLWVVLLRRYYAYAVVGGAVFAAFYWLTYGATKKEPFYRFKNKTVDMLLSVAGPIVGLGVFFPDFLKNSLFNNHLYAYSAYKSTNFGGEWILFARYFGLLLIAYMMVGVLYCIWQKAGRLAVGLLLGLAVTCTTFFRIQDMGPHHYYIVVFPMCFLIFLGFHGLISIGGKRTALRRGIFGLAIFVMAVNFAMSIGIGTPYKNILWGENTYVPKVRSDLKVLRTLELSLEGLSDEGYQMVYCTASTPILNSDILYKLNAPDFNTKINYADVSHVDLRDGFNTKFFDSDIIIACDPPQYHLWQGQEVILRLNEVMLSDNVFSENYTVRNEYALDEGVKATVFVKEKPLERADIEYIKDIFENIYPEYPDLFSNRITAYLNEKY